MDVQPTIRTASREFYLAYLNSPAWRITRNRALERAKYTCSKCGSKRDLQVHHNTYDRLGAELDADLDVVCFGCHRQHHVEQPRTTKDGIYLELVREALRANVFSSIADLAEDVNLLCAKHRIANDPYAIDRALNLIVGSRKTDKGKPYVSVVDAPADEPISAAQAKELLTRLGLPIVVKKMPAVEMISQREADCRKALEFVAKEMQESIRRCEALEAHNPEGV